MTLLEKVTLLENVLEMITKDVKDGEVVDIFDLIKDIPEEKLQTFLTVNREPAIAEAPTTRNYW